MPTPDKPRYPSNYVFTGENTPVDILGGVPEEGAIIGYAAAIINYAGHDIPPEGTLLIDRGNGYVSEINEKFVRRK